MARLTITIPDSWEVSAHGFTLNAARIEEMLENAGDHALMYLVANGFTQSITDAGAMARDERTDAAVAERRAKRFNAIMTGEVGASGPRGPRVTGLDAMARDVAIERLRAAFAKAKRSWPDGKGAAEFIRGKVAELLAHPVHGPSIRAEAERRMSDAPDVADII